MEATVQLKLQKKTKPTIVPETSEVRYETILKALKRQTKLETDKQPKQVHRVIDITIASAVADDAYHALKSTNKVPPMGSVLLSLPEYTGKDIVDCRYYFPEIGYITVPGLNSPIFRTQSVASYTGAMRSSGWELVRLPSIYVILNQCMIALANEKDDQENFKRYGQVKDRRPYNWFRAGCSLREEATALGVRILDIHALRVRQGAGFMALAQANPNLTRQEFGVGLELAREILADIQAKECLQRSEEIEEGKRTGKMPAMRFNTISDIAGLMMTVVARFPATTSESVRVDMHLVICGRGRCCYLNPDVLKTGMEGDVDGDLIASEYDSKLRKVPNARTFVVLPNIVVKDNFLCDFDLGHCFGSDEKDKPLFTYNDYKVYEGMDGKNGIGEATNLFYRGVNIVHICFSQSKETRKEFWDYVGRPDLQERMPKTRKEDKLQRWFRYLAALALMDSIHPIYEGLFDLRKDDSIREYLLHFLRAVRGQEAMNFEYLSEMKIKGTPIDVRAIELIWNYARVGDRAGKPTAFVSQYPIIDLFFGGRGVSQVKKKRMGKIMDTLDSMSVENMAEYLFDEFDGLHFTLMSNDNSSEMEMEMEED